MLFLRILIIIIGVILSIIGFVSLSKAKKIQVEKNAKIKQRKEEIEKLIKETEELKKENSNYLFKKSILLNEIDLLKKEKENFNNELKNKKDEINESLTIYKNLSDLAGELYIEELEKQYQLAEKEYENKINNLEEDKKKVSNELEKIKNSLSAGVEAQLREKEIAEKTDFYKLYISDKDLEDVKKLNNIKDTLYQPVILSKLIWTTYFQKQATQMCNRIFGINPKIGIYKITNLITKQCYIGQSVNIQDRIKQHCKCGLGIEASATNKLYNEMQKEGIWNFTFELLEECSREQLNEKEKMWIEMYQSDKFGMNSTRGNK